MTALAFAPSKLSAQDALDLLNKAVATVRALSKTSYDFEQVEVRDSQGQMGQRSEQRRRLADSGGRYRAEPIPSGPLYLFDGTYRWAYNRIETNIRGRQGFQQSLRTLGSSNWRPIA
jgi:hypothetical protein